MLYLKHYPDFGYPKENVYGFCLLRSVSLKQFYFIYSDLGCLCNNIYISFQTYLLNSGLNLNAAFSIESHFTQYSIN